MWPFNKKEIQKKEIPICAECEYRKESENYERFDYCDSKTEIDYIYGGFKIRSVNEKNGFGQCKYFKKKG